MTDFKFPTQTGGGHFVDLIPVLGEGLQKYNTEDTESIDPTNTMEVFQNEIWPSIEGHFGGDKRILDVGCGNGRFSSFLADYAKEVVAIDAFREISDTHQRKNITFLKQSLQEFEGESFDVVFLFGVLYLQESWGTDAAFERLVTKLSPGGVIITVDDKKRDIRGQSSNQLPPGYYNLNDLCNTNAVSLEHQFIQQNNIHRITTIRK